MQGCTLFTLEHRQRVAWLQTLSKQQHEFLRTQCGGTIARVLSEPVTKLVLAYTQIIRPAHMCTCLASSARASAPTPADTAFLGCTTRGRIRPRQLRRAWQREWEHFASCWAASAAPPMSLTFSAYRHVAVALQSGVLLPRAAASATMYASELVSSPKKEATASAIFTSVPTLSSALVIIVCMFNTTHARTLFVEQTEGEHAPKENMDGHARTHAHSHAHNYTHPHQTNALVHLARCCPACTSFPSPAPHSICRTH